jgi:predicted ATPase with chaperone activity
MRAYQVQRERFKNSKTKFNGQMTEKEVEKYCPFGAKGKGTFGEGYEQAPSQRKVLRKAFKGFKNHRRLGGRRANKRNIT